MIFSKLFKKEKPPEPVKLPPYIKKRVKSLPAKHTVDKVSVGSKIEYRTEMPVTRKRTNNTVAAASPYTPASHDSGSSYASNYSGPCSSSSSSFSSSCSSSSSSSSCGDF